MSGHPSPPTSLGSRPPGRRLSCLSCVLCPVPRGLGQETTRNWGLCLDWNDERVAELRRLWAEGLSCSVIASRLGHTSRNAVIGKASRLGLPQRATTVRRTYKRKPSTYNKPPVWTRPTTRARIEALHFRPEPIPSPQETDVPRKALVDLEETDCRWPCLDVEPGGLQMFCGSPKMEGLPYCEPHARRAFQPPQPRRSERSVPITNIRIPEREDA